MVQRLSTQVCSVSSSLAGMHVGAPALAGQALSRARCSWLLEHNAGALHAALSVSWVLPVTAMLVLAAEQPSVRAGQGCLPVGHRRGGQGAGHPMTPRQICAPTCTAWVAQHVQVTCL